MLSDQDTTTMFRYYVAANNRGESFQDLGVLVRAVATAGTLDCPEFKTLKRLAGKDAVDEPRKLRPFTDDDWQAFAGCECDAPEICYYEDQQVEYCEPAVLILDGTTVQVLVGEDGDDVWSAEFNTPAVARLVAERLLKVGNDGLDTTAESLGLKLLR